MSKNKHIDLFKDIIPAVDLRMKELWDAEDINDEARKEIKNDLWRLNRFISSVQSENVLLQEHYLLTVNEYYNKNWSNISKHPKLQWQTLCMCGHDTKKKYYHEYIPLKNEKNKKEAFLEKLFPNMKRVDIETLAAIATDKEIKQYCRDLGWDEKDIHGIKI